MTVSSTVARNIDTCNGVTTVRTIPYKLLDATHVNVYRYTIATGAVSAPLTLNVDYTIQNVGLDNAQYTMASADSSAFKLINIRNVPFSQAADYVQNDSFPAETHEAALDKLTMIAQQMQDTMKRAASLPLFADPALVPVLPIPQDGYGLIWSGTGGTIVNTSVSMATLQTQAAALFAIAGNITTVAGISANVTTVAGIQASVSTVASANTQVVAVGNSIANVNTVAGGLTNINTVAGIQANVTTVAGISGNVTTVAGISANVTSVAGNATNINNVAADLTNINNVAADLTNINLVAADLTNIDAVKNAITNINTVAGISGNVTTVAGVSASVTTLAGISANITTVAGISANVTTVAGISASVTTVAADHTSIVNVAADLANIDTCASNITSINNASANASSAASSASAASTSATNAANYAAALTDTSTTSLAIGTGSKTFTCSSGKQFAAGQFISAVSAANNTNFMHGQVTSYSGTTLIVNVLDIGGSGTKTDWNLSISGSQGPTGAAGSVSVAAAAGTVDAITATPPNVTLADMTVCAIVSSGANTLTNPTFAPNSLTAHTITKNGGSALVAGDTGGANYVMLLEYNLANTRWELLNPAKVGGGDIISSVALAGNPTTTTQAVGTNNTTISTTAFAMTAASNAALAANAGNSVDCATTASLTGTYASVAAGIGDTFTVTATGVQTVDGHTVAINELILLKDQSSAFQNGIYKVTVAGAIGVSPIYTRALDYDQSSDINNTGPVSIINGTVNGGAAYILTTKVTNVGTDALTYTIFTPKYANIIQSGGAGGTPSSLTLTNATGLPVAGIASMAANTVVANATNGSASPTAVALTASTFLGMGSTGNIAACTLGSGLAFSGAVLNLGGTYRTTSSADNLAATDNNGMIDFTGSTNRTFTATAAATLGNGWSTIVRNNSTANITIDPNASETIDTLTTIVMYPGETRLITCTGSAFISFVLKGMKAVFTASGSFTVPPGYTKFEIEILSGGGSGASRTTTGNSGGGSGGGYYGIVVAATGFVAAGSTETVTIGGTAAGVSGNTNGTAGNASSLTINGVTLLVQGASAAVNAASGVVATGGNTALNQSMTFNALNFGDFYTNMDYGQGGDVTVGNVPQFLNGALYQNKGHAGGSGGASSSTAGGTRTGGLSIFAGAGGAGGANTGGNGTNGTAPGGGGGGAVQGGTSGSGAAGQVTIRGIV